MNPDSDGQTDRVLGRWEWDIATDVVAWDEHLYAIYGLPTDMPIGYETFLAHVHPDDRAMAREHVERAFAEAARFDMDVRVVRPDGSVRLLQSQGYVVTDGDGKPIRMIGSALDITSAEPV